MDPELSDSDSDDFDECLLQQDHLNLLRALGSPMRKVLSQWARFTPLSGQDSHRGGQLK